MLDTDNTTIKFAKYSRSKTRRRVRNTSAIVVAVLLVMWVCDVGRVMYDGQEPIVTVTTRLRLESHNDGGLKAIQEYKEQLRRRRRAGRQRRRAWRRAWRRRRQRGRGRGAANNGKQPQQVK